MNFYSPHSTGYCSVTLQNVDIAARNVFPLPQAYSLQFFLPVAGTVSHFALRIEQVDISFTNRLFLGGGSTTVLEDFSFLLKDSKISSSASNPIGLGSATSLAAVRQSNWTMQSSTLNVTTTTATGSALIFPHEMQSSLISILQSSISLENSGNFFCDGIVLVKRPTGDRPTLLLIDSNITATTSTARELGGICL